MKISIKKIYFYLVSLITLLIIITSAASLIDIGLKATIFKDADKSAFVEPRVPKLEDEGTEIDQDQIVKDETQRLKSQRQRTAARSISFLIVAVPTFWYHWRRVRREKI